MTHKMLFIGLVCLGMIVGCEQKTAAPDINLLPANHPSVIKGVDISKWQGIVDFAKIKADGKVYVFIKATQGSTELDKNYNRNIKEARAAGLAASSYHFYLTDDKPDAQFANFSKHISLQPGDLPPVVDIEILAKNSLPNTAAELKIFLDMMEKKHGVKPIIYSGKSFANEYLKGFADYLLWLAEYNKDKTPQLPKDWPRWVFWQHTQGGTVAGVEGKVDLDRFNGDQQQFQDLLVR